MIFAAGLGTRLFPLTQNCPKALVEINGISLLKRAILKISAAGFNDIIINIHHYPDLIIKHINENHFNSSTKICFSDERELLLDTGGGLKNAKHFFNDNTAFLVYNVDILCDIDLKKFYNTHINNHSLATLAVQKRNGNRAFLFDETDSLCGWTNREKSLRTDARKGTGKLTELGFSGIHIIQPELLDLITESGVFSIKETYLRLAKDNIIKSYRHDADWWTDAGTIPCLNEASEHLLKNEFLSSHS